MATSPAPAVPTASAPSTASAGAETKRRILDAAEALFAEHGVAATSLRAVIARAGVNSAAIHYHFGSKDALIEALFSRRIAPINEERLRRLDDLERDGSLDHDSLLRAFLEPMLGSSAPRGEQGRVAGVAIGRLLTEPPRSSRLLAEEQVREVKRSFALAVANTSPGVSVEEAMERLEYAMGAMLHTLAHSALIHSPQSLGETAGELMRPRIDRMIRFLAAGLGLAASEEIRAPSTRGCNGH